MMNQQPSRYFSADQIKTVHAAATMAEELVSNYFKMSPNQWLQPKYDVRTLRDLAPSEIVDGPFAQIIRYEGKRKGSSLGSEAYDFYKICLQDHAVLAALNQNRDLSLLPLCLYIIAHELIHIIRFSRFLQNFDATPDEKLAEERRVHQLTHQVLTGIRTPGLAAVLNFFQQWREPIEGLSEP